VHIFRFPWVAFIYRFDSWVAFIYRFDCWVAFINRFDCWVAFIYRFDCHYLTELSVRLLYQLDKGHITFSHILVTTVCLPVCKLFTFQSSPLKLLSLLNHTLQKWSWSRKKTWLPLGILVSINWKFGFKNILLMSRWTDIKL
jgi:hypothetical protein